MKVALTNVGTIVTGDWRDPFGTGDTIITSNGKIANRIAFESMSLNDDFLENPIVLSKMYSRYHQLAYYTIN